MVWKIKNAFQLVLSYTAWLWKRFYFNSFFFLFFLSFSQCALFLWKQFFFLLLLLVKDFHLSTQTHTHTCILFQEGGWKGKTEDLKLSWLLKKKEKKEKRLWKRASRRRRCLKGSFFSSCESQILGNFIKNYAKEKIN